MSNPIEVSKYFFVSGLSFWGLMFTCLPISYLVYKQYPAKKILFVFLMIVAISIYYISNIVYSGCFEKMKFEILIQVFAIIVDAVLLFIYVIHCHNEKRNTKNEEKVHKQIDK